MPNSAESAGFPRQRTLVGLTLTALFAALTAAGTFIAIPLPFSPVPIVLQNLFSLLSGLVLGPLLGGAAVGLYLTAGALGAPVFAHNGGPMGIARFFGPTGGYLLGYLLGAVAAGLIAGRPKSGIKTPTWRVILAVITGILVVYIPGLLRLSAMMGGSLGKTLGAGFFPFLIGDSLKAVVAVLAAPRLRRAAADHLDG